MKLMLVNQKACDIELHGKTVAIPSAAVRTRFMGDIDIVFLGEDDNVIIEGEADSLYEKAIIQLPPSTLIKMKPEGVPGHIWVVTSKPCSLCSGGATSALLDKTGVECFAEMEQDDIYIIPSSIHECIVLPVKKAASFYKVREMLHEVNDTLPSVKLLSNEVFLYDKETGEISLVSTEETESGEPVDASERESEEPEMESESFEFTVDGEQDYRLETI